MTDALQRLTDRIRDARRITVMTGAGISAASGVPTFRGPEGLWHRFRPEELATAEAFARDPALVWEWYEWRRERVASCTPNRGHEVLAAWTERNRDCRIVTQNVDDLHVRAGTRGLVRLHGSIWELSCWDRCRSAPRTWRDEQVPLPERPPRCPSCGGLARPAVVWFGESLDPADVAAAHDATSCDVFLTVGTSAIVYPAAAFVHDARRRGAFTAEINLEATPATSAVDIAIHGPAEAILADIDAQLCS